MKALYVYLLGAICLISCDHEDKKTKDYVHIDSSRKKHVVIIKQTFNDTLLIPDDTIPKINLPDSTVQVAEEQSHPGNKVLILCADCSSNGQDNIGPKDAKLAWKGIFFKKDKFFIKPVKIKFIKEHSEFDETPEAMTGWRLKVLDKDSCTNVISGIELANGPVKKIKFKDFYYAGQKFEFNYGGVPYTLYTTGTKRNGKIYNFKIFLTAKIKGHIFNQLLRSLGDDIALNGGGDNVNVLFISFIGDIDGDNIPDFIIDDGAYAFGSTSLYMSKTAGDKSIVKLVGYFSQPD